MSTSAANDADASLNWSAIAALYTGVILGLAGMLYAGLYRNAAWLALLGTGGALTAYGRLLEQRGDEQPAHRWKRAAGLVYGVFFLWAGAVLLRMLLGMD
ncbi:MAG: hypothetical protein BRD39_01100 [Bacteroidetes bacterium QH_9_64_21]|nr:MAG: hypothetical protein BRD39_01100 [Bacteroidetes bacterium QH_9_64_21]PSQ81751.1 MAG: hypothetical protein BRD41_01815 [Bacteroidetes bacterium QS_1_63_11]